MTSRARAKAALGSRRDDNEDEIVEALEAAGCLVACVTAVGVPDLIVWSPHPRSPPWCGRCGSRLGAPPRIILLEVKNTKRYRADGKLRPSQTAFHEKWTAAGAPVFKVTTVDEALRAVGAK